MKLWDTLDGETQRALIEWYNVLEEDLESYFLRTINERGGQS